MPPADNSAEPPLTDPAPTAAPAEAPVVGQRGAPPPPRGAMGFAVRHQALIVPLCALVIAFVIGGVLIRLEGFNPTYAYRQLFEYSLFSAAGLQVTLAKASPLILVGLAVALPLKVGLFNIGGQGQLIAGGIGAAWIAWALRDVPGPILIVSAVIIGILFGAMWASIAALLKTSRGVHEVITTIMLNSIAAGILDWLINGGPLSDRSQAFPTSYAVPPGSRLEPIWIIPPGLPIALLLAVLIAGLLRRTTLGFELHTVGSNVFAARYAGISATKVTLIAMASAGGLAGLAGALELLQTVPYRFQTGTVGTLGFDGITIALLARGNPIGTIPAALLVGAMRAGAPRLQFDIGIRPELVDLLLAITLLMVSLPLLAQLIFRRYAVKASALAGSGGR